MEFKEKIRVLRESEGLKREELAEITGIKKRTIEGVERDRIASGPVLRDICMAYPHYTLWLMIDEVKPDAGQVSPLHMKMVREWLEMQGKTLPIDQMVEAVSVFMELDNHLDNMAEKNKPALTLENIINGRV